ncbi:MAG: AmmeMemoRadiSam system protein B [Proteobacteria bacterium]|nr:AmmeMemoRadiSam system protein B [Pseudomonadota bacterium]
MSNQRDTAVSGLFYPSDPEELGAQVSQFLALAPTSDRRDVKFLIVPHAGYIYSGQIAATCFAEINTSHIERVILIGPSHHHYFDGLVACGSSSWKTPTGLVPIERNRSDFINTDSRFHRQEHSLEVQIPFLKYLLPQISYFPLLVSGQLSQGDELAKKLSHLDTSNTLWVISSDFSHVGPRFGYDTTKYGFESGEELDKEAIHLIQTGNSLQFQSFMESTKATICGALPILIAMHLRKELGCPEFLLRSYDSSGNQTGDINSVGYAAISC